MAPSRAPVGASRASAAGLYQLSAGCSCAGMQHELFRECGSRVAPLRRARGARDGEIARNRHFWCILVIFWEGKVESLCCLVRDNTSTFTPITRAPTRLHARSTSILGENLGFGGILVIVGRVKRGPRAGEASCRVALCNTSIFTPVTRAPTCLHARSTSILGENRDFWALLGPNRPRTCA